MVWAWVRRRRRLFAALAVLGLVGLVARAVLPLGPARVLAPLDPRPFRRNHTSWRNEWRHEWHEQCGYMARALAAYEREVAAHPERQPVVFHTARAGGLGERLQGAYTALTLAMVTGRPFRLATESHFAPAYVTPAFAALDWTTSPAPADPPPLPLTGDEDSDLAEQLTHGRRGPLFDYTQPLYTSRPGLPDFPHTMCALPPAERPFPCSQGLR